MDTNIWFLFVAFFPQAVGGSAAAATGTLTADIPADRTHQTKSSRENPKCFGRRRDEDTLWRQPCWRSHLPEETSNQRPANVISADQWLIIGDVVSMLCYSWHRLSDISGHIDITLFPLQGYSFFNIYIDFFFFFLQNVLNTTLIFDFI